MGEHIDNNLERTIYETATNVGHVMVMQANLEKKLELKSDKEYVEKMNTDIMDSLDTQYKSLIKEVNSNSARIAIIENKLLKWLGILVGALGAVQLFWLLFGQNIIELFK